jgi:hypothetical protein
LSERCGIRLIPNHLVRDGDGDDIEGGAVDRQSFA